MRSVILILALTGCSENIDQSKPESIKFEKFIWETSIAARPAMLDDFLDNHDVSQLSRKGVVSLLGEPDGYYLYDEFPAYRFKLTGDCVVAFPIDRKTNKVKEVIIEPQGCSKIAN